MIAEMAVRPGAEFRDRGGGEGGRVLEGTSVSAAPVRRPSVSDRRQRERKLLAVGLAISAAVHAVALLAVSVQPLEWSTRGESRTPVAIQLPALQAVELPTPRRPAPPPELVRDEVAPAAAAIPAAVAEPEIPVLATAAPLMDAVPLDQPPPMDSVVRSHAAAPLPLESAERGRYEQEVTRWVERQRNYPLGARQRRLEGTAIVRIQVAGDGALLDARLVRDTGHAMLDRAALDMIHRAAPYPSVPRSLSSSPVEVLVPIQFTLSR